MSSHLTFAELNHDHRTQCPLNATFRRVERLKSSVHLGTEIDRTGAFLRLWLGTDKGLDDPFA